MSTPVIFGVEYKLAKQKAKILALMSNGSNPVGEPEYAILVHFI
jgi:hypothetical protein